ncbi:urea amidolyase associated protein UAAP1 [Alkalicoccus chagannorensis]|uniref:urea amidolyase associated protein UAAP1 n=1 Tax=Alkalicoccus chagannorensis TaxID=427072 RepID=UPI000428F033|nr:urea amidolyase associated protein UAAP1 [Alkalicoccus chagannorensis]
MYQHTLSPGAKWSEKIAAGKQVTLRAEGDGANVSALLYAADHPYAERYNMPDTLKAQHTSHLTEGHQLMSDNGRTMALITKDTVGWHDPIGGYSTRAATEKRYGTTSYQEHLNDWLRCGEENLQMELFRHGLTARDLVPNINFFSKVQVQEDGTMQFIPDNSSAGDEITFVTDMDVILVLSNTPHPFDPADTYPSQPVTLTAVDAPEIDRPDPLGENKRARENTADYHELKRTTKEVLS